MTTQFTSTYVERKMTLDLADPQGSAAVNRAIVTLSGTHVVNLDVVLVTGAHRHVHLYSAEGRHADGDGGFLYSDEQYAVARDAAREAVRHFKVRVKDIDPHTARLLLLTRADHEQAREQELTDYFASIEAQQR